MDLLRCFFCVDDFKKVPSKKMVINSALGILFLFMLMFNVMGIPIGTAIWFNSEKLLNLESLIICTIGGWAIVTAWFTVGNEESSEKSKLIAYSLLSIVGMYMLAPILFLAFTYKFIMGSATVLWFALLVGLSSVVKKYGAVIAKLRWLFLGLIVICYSSMFLFDMYGERYSFETIWAVNAGLYLLELIIVSYFIVWELVNFRLHLESGYDKDILIRGSESADESNNGLDELAYTLKTMFVLQISFMMLIMFCLRIGGLIKTIFNVNI